MKIGFLISLSLISGLAGACDIIDTDEIGDIGPALDLVCKDLERHLDYKKNVSVTNRRILSANSVEFDIGPNRNKVRYRLKGSSWKIESIE